MLLFFVLGSQDSSGVKGNTTGKFKLETGKWSFETKNFFKFLQRYVNVNGFTVFLFYYIIHVKKNQTVESKSCYVNSK